MLCAFIMTSLILQKFYGVISAVNTQAIKNICFRFRFSFSDILHFVAALYNPFQTCL